MSKIRIRIAIAGMFGAIVLAAVAVDTLAAQAAGGGKADSGVSYAGNDVNCGKFVCVSGYTFDKLHGQGATTYKIALGIGKKPGTFKVTAKPVTMFMANGSLTGSATATLTVGAKGASKITGGKLNLPTGHGGLAGHSFVGTFTGTGNSTTGYYTFKYQGTYK